MKQSERVWEQVSLAIIIGDLTYGNRLLSHFNELRVLLTFAMEKR